MAHRITTSVTFQLTDDPNVYIELGRVSYDYDGPVASHKKGRETEAKVADQQLATSQADAATRKAQLDAMSPDLQALDVQPGHLSSAAESRLGADLDRIGTTYNNMGQVGLKNIAQRGINGPSGAASSLENSLLMSRAHDENAAHDAAQQESHNDMLAAVNARTGLQNIYNPNAAAAGAGESAFHEGQMGSTLGDIGKGLGTAASLAGSVVGAGGLTNLPSNFMNGK